MQKSSGVKLANKFVSNGGRKVRKDIKYERECKST